MNCNVGKRWFHFRKMGFPRKPYISSNTRCSHSDSATTIHFAAQEGLLEQVNYLVELEADIDKADNNGATPLWMASQRGHIEVVWVLIFSKADINKQANDWTSPLWIASQNGHIEVAQALIFSKAEVDMEANDRSTPLLTASQNGHAEVARFLISVKAEVNKTTDGSATPLWMASQHGLLEVAEALLSRKADVDNIASDGSTALSRASQNGFLQIAEALLNGRANVNTPDLYGRTPLMLAVSKFQEPLVDVLLKNKADASIHNILDGLTALHCACDNKTPNCANMILDAGCNIDARDIGLCTPFLYACYIENAQVVDTLVQRGADVTAKCWNGNCGLQLAACKGNTTIVHTILKTSQARIDSKNIFGMSPLHLAAKRGHVNVVEVLVNKSADLSIQDNVGNTPLHLAVIHRQQDVIDFLLMQPNQDQNVFLKNVYGMSVIDYLSTSFPQTHRALSAEQSPQRIAKEAHQRIPTFVFTKNASRFINNVAVQNVKLIRSNDLLKYCKFVPYNYCEEKCLHISGNEVLLGHRVLFVSHRWENDDDPDPDGAQFALLVAFLKESKKAGNDFDFLWLDYCCICQDKESALFKKQRNNIPTAIWMATECLIIPKLADSVTDLKDYLTRAWCVLETCSFLLCGTPLTLSFKAGNFQRFKRFENPEEMASDLGFVSSELQAWDELLTFEQSNLIIHNYEIIDSACSKWNVPDPCRILVLLSEVFKAKDETMHTIFKKVLCMQLQQEDASLSAHVSEIWNLLGNCNIIEDKVLVFNIMMLIGYFTLKANCIRNFHQKNTQLECIQTPLKDLKHVCWVEDFPQQRKAHFKSIPLITKVFFRPSNIKSGVINHLPLPTKRAPQGFCTKNTQIVSNSLKICPPLTLPKKRVSQRSCAKCAKLLYNSWKPCLPLQLPTKRTSQGPSRKCAKLACNSLKTYPPLPTKKVFRRPPVKLATGISNSLG